MGLSGRCVALLAAFVVLIPGTASAAGDVVDLPFLGDEAGFPEEPLLDRTWPDRMRPEFRKWWQTVGITPDRSDDDAREMPDVPAWLFPDVDDLLAPVGGAVDIDDATVAVHDTHPDAERVRRLLGAVRSAYARSVRVRIAVARASEGEPLRPVASIDAQLRPGGLLVVDGTRDEVWPAEVYDTPVLVTPRPFAFRVGTHAALCVIPLSGDRAVLDLDLHVAESAGERAFDDESVRRVVPIVAHGRLRATLPMRLGTSTRLALGDLIVQVQVDRPSTEVIPGLRAIPLPPPAWLVPAVQTHPRTGELETSGYPTYRSVTVPRDIPDAWLSVAREAGVRLVAVPPGIAVAEGDEDALRTFDVALAELRHRRARVVRDTESGLVLATVVDSPWTFVNARLTPTTADTRAEIEMERANVASLVMLAPSGTYTHGAWSETSLGVTVDQRWFREREARDVRIATDEKGGAADAVRLTADDLTSSLRRFTLDGVPDEHSTASLTDLEGWE